MSTPKAPAEVLERRLDEWLDEGRPTPTEQRHERTKRELCGDCHERVQVGDGSDCWVCSEMLCGQCRDGHISQCELEFRERSSQLDIDREARDAAADGEVDRWKDEHSYDEAFLEERYRDEGGDR